MHRGALVLAGTVIATWHYYMTYPIAVYGNTVPLDLQTGWAADNCGAPCSWGWEPHWYLHQAAWLCQVHQVPVYAWTLWVAQGVVIPVMCFRCHMSRGLCWLVQSSPHSTTTWCTQLLSMEILLRRETQWKWMLTNIILIPVKTWDYRYVSTYDTSGMC